MAARKWTSSQKNAQRALIKNWKPWRFGGPKTVAGKQVSKMNATKHGLHSIRMRELRKRFKATKNIKEFELLAKKYLLCMRKLDLDQIEEVDRTFRERFEQLVTSFETSENRSPEILIEIEYVRSVFQQTIMATLRELSRSELKPVR
jgi:hypothetical protein